jgi:2-C-methyl-D-erythritol 4-phosphate cytidylyltransferase
VTGVTTAAIVPAAGSGQRLGGAGPKALLPVGGVPMLVHAVRRLSAAAEVSLVVVAAPPDRVEETRRLLGDAHAGAELSVVAGGATRVASVRAALDVLPRDVDVVLVHDAARPLAPSSLAEAVAAAVHAGADAVVPGVPLPDTVKRVEGDEVTSTVDRSGLRAVQTPQGFRRDVLDRAHRAADGGDPSVTDDAGMVERLGLRVVVVPGHEEAFKVTRPIDLVLAESVLAAGGDRG